MLRPKKDQPQDLLTRLVIHKPNASLSPQNVPLTKNDYKPVARHTRSRVPHTVDHSPPRVSKSTYTGPISRRTQSQTAAMANVITRSQAAKRRYPAQFLQILEMPVLDGTSGQSLQYCLLCKHLKFAHLWKKYYANELGRLCQGIGRGSKVPKNQLVEVMNTFRIINFQDIPQDIRKEKFHSMFVCEVKPHKEDTNGTRITVAGSQICYPGNVCTPTGCLDLFNLTINSVLYFRNTRFFCFDFRKLLPPNPDGEIRVCAHKTLRYPTRIHWRI